MSSTAVITFGMIKDYYTPKIFSNNTVELILDKCSVEKKKRKKNNLIRFGININIISFWRLKKRDVNITTT